MKPAVVVGVAAAVGFAIGAAAGYESSVTVQHTHDVKYTVVERPEVFD